MLRFARVPLRMKTGQNTVRQCSSKPTNGNKVPQQATSAPKVESKQHPEVDPNFKSKFTGFMVIQSVLLAFFGVAYKMEEDEAFEAKIESHYANLSFLKPTMNTFREVIRVVQPPVKKTPPPSIDAFVPLAEEPIPESTNNNEIVAKEEFTPVVEEVDAVEALHEPEDEPESEPIVEITPSGPTDEEIEALRLKQEEEEKAQQLRKEQEEQLQKKLDELEAKTKAFQLELEASAAKAAEAENQVVVLPTVDAENRMHDVRVETSELALEEMSRYANKTRQDLQMSLLQNLSSLDEAELRERITQLAAEFFERTKWEGLRLHESLKQLEGELTDKYTGIMNEQRAELQVISSLLFFEFFHCYFLLFCVLVQNTADVPGVG